MGMILKNKAMQRDRSELRHIWDLWDEENNKPLDTPMIAQKFKLDPKEFWAIEVMTNSIPDHYTKYDI